VVIPMEFNNYLQQQLPFYLPPGSRQGVSTDSLRTL
jgi:hypothetical protein